MLNDKKELIGLFPGSFDPFTKGHEDIVLRGAKLVDKLIIAIGNNTQKSRMFPVEVMKQKIEEAFKDNPKISVEIYSGLTSHYAKEINANILLRGLRNTTDFEYENTIAQVNNYLNEELETVFLITSPQFAYISSSIVRELHKFGTDVSAFLPYSIN
ncbi:MAG: pantetheine-phosphate adenylyltransferase [Cytophagales bacterium]